MPRLSEAMKDVTSCDKLWGDAHNLRSIDFRMGQPGYLKNSHRKGQTQGTETSKYLEEKKTISDSVSSGERTRISPNQLCLGIVGVVGLQMKHY
jgi:hypothetical protein